jgi:DNA-binding GntR family transcriptional regulator
LKLTKVKRERASDAVFNLLRASILDQTFLPGERLNVRTLAERLDVSLTPVKDAITRLAVEGLIEIRPRSGTFVSSISPEDIQETLSIRRALECLAAQTILKNMTDEDLAECEEMVALLDRPVNSERERQQHEKKNNEFHLKLVQMSGNKKLIEIYGSLNAHIKIARVHYTSNSWASRLQQERSEHHKILEALITRKQKMLESAINDHIVRASEALVNDVLRSANAKKERPEPK